MGFWTRLIKTSILASLLTSVCPFLAYADLVRIAHYPAAMRAMQVTDEVGTFREWKVTNAIPRKSPWASGFVVEVRDGLRFSDWEKNYNLEPYDYVNYLYPNGTTFKAVYILTNHHVWYNDRADLQAAGKKLNPNSNRYTVMTATDVQIHNNSVQNIFSNTYFTQLSPINTWMKTKYSFTPENMGLREIQTCLQPNNVVDSIGNLNFRWGCDFSLIRILVPSSVDVKAEKISSHGPAIGDSLSIWYSPSRLGNYRVVKKFGDKGEAIVADIENYSYVATPGWSGSPVLNKASKEVVGLLFSGWPGNSTMTGIYSIDYVMKNLKVRENIESDFKFLESGFGLLGGPYKGNFYGVPSFLQMR